MGKNTDRKRIGLFFTGNDSWIGGLYYIINIIKGFNLLNNDTKPEIVLFYNENTPKDLLSSIDYPFLEKVNYQKEYNLLQRGFSSFMRRFANRNLQFEWLFKKHNVSAVYPFFNFEPSLSKVNVRVIYWIYDFQHIFLPEYFTEDESQNRNKQFALLAENANEIVVSSEDAASHFKKLYPESKSELHVLHFASMIPDFEPINFVSLKEKFLLSERPFFLISNQFWQHKNHRVVFEAIKLLQATSEGFQFDFIFTGKEQDDRNPNYVPDLKKYIAEERLSNIKMLGFIGRDEQLSLMSYAQAVIQPSKFEGWGTVVEDAKMLGVPVILSDLQVHKEQLGEDGLYFERDSAESLVGAIKLLLSSNQNCLDISKEQILSGFRRELQHIFLES